jgi:membrane protein implicated in regulation of membrane protease activity
MHHLILLLPVFGIVVFWLFPLSLAIPIYMVILAISGLMYWAIVRAIRKIPRANLSFVGDKAIVASRLGPRDRSQYMVEVHGELWGANSPDELRIGESVIITDARGTVLTVKLDQISENKPP